MLNFFLKMHGETSCYKQSSDFNQKLWFLLLSLYKGRYEILHRSLEAEIFKFGDQSQNGLPF